MHMQNGHTFFFLRGKWTHFGGTVATNIELVFFLGKENYILPTISLIV